MSTDPLQETLQRVRECFRRARESETAYGEMLPFYQRMCELQEAAAVSACPGELPHPVREDRHRPPMKDRGRIPIDMPSAAALFQDLLAAAGEAGPGSANRVSRLHAHFDDNPERILYCLRISTEREGVGLSDLSQAIGVPPGLLELFCFGSLWPSLAVHVRRMVNRPEGPPAPGAAGCPLCGGQPAISLLEENGGRTLVCSFCRYPWPVPRLQCPFCSNTDAETMGYHDSEEEPGRRIDICDRCSSYWITVDIRRLGRPFYAPLETLVATHLVLRAEQMGYGRPAAAAAATDGIG
jgi:FdhE protein